MTCIPVKTAINSFIEINCNEENEAIGLALNYNCLMIVQAVC